MHKIDKIYELFLMNSFLSNFICILILWIFNYGKCIFGKAEFNFDRFNNLLMDLRIINALRNYEKQSRFLTLEEYKCLVSDSSDGILKKTMRQLNFKLAFQITKFLGLPEKEIYLKFAVKKIKKIGLETEELANKFLELKKEQI